MRGRITPSDIDMVVESHGCLLVCEITRDAESWHDLKAGQRILLMNVARLPGTHCVAILRHGLMSISKEINTATDIVEATVYFDSGSKSVVLDGDAWRDFAVLWTFNSAQAINDVLRPRHAR